MARIGRVAGVRLDDDDVQRGAADLCAALRDRVGRDHAHVRGQRSRRRRGTVTRIGRPGASARRRGRALCIALERGGGGAAGDDVQARPLGSPERRRVADAARAVADDERPASGSECEDEHRARFRRAGAAPSDVVDVDGHVEVAGRGIGVGSGDGVVAAAPAYRPTRRGAVSPVDRRREVTERGGGVAVVEVGDHPVERLQRDGRRSTGKSQRRIDDGHRERQRGGEPGRIGDDDRSRVRAFLGERVLRALPRGGAAVIERPVERQSARTARA